MTADRPTVTGPTPAPESTHAPGPVFRDRGVIIANQQARIAELELACQRLRDSTQGAHAERDQAKAEAERLRESRDRWRQGCARACVRAEAAEAETAALRARIQALADEWDAAVDARGGSTLAPVRFLARDLRAALAGAPAVTPTETQAEGGAWTCGRCGSGRWVSIAPGGPDWPRKAQCVPCGAVHALPAPVADPTTGGEA